jgi:hypothetical protein
MHSYEFLCFIVYPCMIIMMIFICYLWMLHGKRKKTLFCAKIGIVMPLVSFIFNAQIQWEFLYFLMNC